MLSEALLLSTIQDHFQIHIFTVNRVPDIGAKIRKSEMQIKLM